MFVPSLPSRFGNKQDVVEKKEIQRYFGEPLSKSQLDIIGRPRNHLGKPSRPHQPPRVGNQRYRLDQTFRKFDLARYPLHFRFTLHPPRSFITLHHNLQKNAISAVEDLIGCKTYFVKSGQGILARNIFAILRREPFQNRIDQKRPPGYPLHWQHEERVERQ